MTFYVLADVVWPALFLSIRLAAWWCVIISIVIEGLALWTIARVPPAKALFASLIMNVVSAFIGKLLLPMMGIRLELFASSTYNVWLDWGTFNPVTYVATWMGATLLTTIIECFTLWLAFAMPWKRRWVIVVLVANAITVALAGLSVMVWAPH